MDISLSGSDTVSDVPELSDDPSDSANGVRELPKEKQKSKKLIRTSSRPDSDTSSLHTAFADSIHSSSRTARPATSCSNSSLNSDAPRSGRRGADSTGKQPQMPGPSNGSTSAQVVLKRWKFLACYFSVLVRIASTWNRACNPRALFVQINIRPRVPV